MVAIQFTFNREKAAEVIIYLAGHVPEPTFLVLSKLIYFIDKTSLETCGRFVTGDTYYAMQHGPVPTSIYDMFKEARGSVGEGFKVEGAHTVVPLRAPDLDKLSQSDVRCIDQILAMYGSYPAWRLREISHDAAWTHIWEDSGHSGSTAIPLEAIAATFDEGEDLLDYLRETHKVDKR